MSEESPTISIEDCFQQPELLVGCRIKHRFETDRELVWYEGTVLQMNSETKELQVAYDDDDICCFPLRHCKWGFANQFNVVTSAYHLRLS